MNTILKYKWWLIGAVALVAVVIIFRELNTAALKKKVAGCS